MPKKPDERIVQAKRMFLNGMKLVEIASQLSLPEGTVRRWKSTHKWDNERSGKKDANVRKKRGGQPGNKNATGPPGNKHAEKHGFFSKWLPAETLEIINEMSEDPLELLWDQITFQYAAIVRAQNLMYVKDKESMTKEVLMDGDAVTAYDIQYAWDKHSTFMGAQSRAIKTFLSAVKDYEDMVHKNWDMATEEQRARIELLKVQKDKLNKEVGTNNEIQKVVIVNDV